MGAKKKLYSLIKLYLENNLTTQAFCYPFADVYDFETDHKILSQEENKYFKELAYAAYRFSPEEENQWPTEIELREMVKNVADKLGISLQIYEEENLPPKCKVRNKFVKLIKGSISPEEISAWANQILKKAPRPPQDSHLWNALYFLSQINGLIQNNQEDKKEKIALYLRDFDKAIKSPNYVLQKILEHHIPIPEFLFYSLLLDLIDEKFCVDLSIQCMLHHKTQDSIIIEVAGVLNSDLVTVPEILQNTVKKYGISEKKKEFYKDFWEQKINV